MSGRKPEVRGELPWFQVAREWVLVRSKLFALELGWKGQLGHDRALAFGVRLFEHATNRFGTHSFSGPQAAQRILNIGGCPRADKELVLRAAEQVRLLIRTKDGWVLNGWDARYADAQDKADEHEATRQTWEAERREKKRLQKQKERREKRDREAVEKSRRKAPVATSGVLLGSTRYFSPTACNHEECVAMSPGCRHLDIETTVVGEMATGVASSGDRSVAAAKAHRTAPSDKRSAEIEGGRCECCGEAWKHFESCPVPRALELEAVVFQGGQQLWHTAGSALGAWGLMQSIRWRRHQLKPEPLEAFVEFDRWLAELNEVEDRTSDVLDGFAWVYLEDLAFADPAKWRVATYMKPGVWPGKVAKARELRRLAADRRRL